MYFHSPPRRPWLGTVTCFWRPDRMARPDPWNLLRPPGRDDAPAAPGWKRRGRHHGVTRGPHGPAPGLRKRRGTDPAARRVQRAKQRRLDRHLCDPFREEWAGAAP